MMNLRFASTFTTTLVLYDYLSFEDLLELGREPFLLFFLKNDFSLIAHNIASTLCVFVYRVVYF